MAAALGAASKTWNLGDCNAAYKAVTEVLTPRSLQQPSDQDQSQLLEIEVLGRSHPVPSGLHLIQDENAIAVPKHSLILAFIEARRRFQQLAQDIPRHQLRLLEATAVLLLFDPEHLTAANMRKRILLLQCRRASIDETAIIVSREMWLVDSLLTSRLNRHTKSPTLWAHRRWLMSTCITTWGLPIKVYDSFVDVVMTSAERHPRNYYAWSHARYLMTVHGTQTDCTKCAEQGHETRRIAEAVKKWVFRHHNDTSGWSFLEHLGLYMPGEEWASIVNETTELAGSLRWTGESVWVFLRSAIASRKSRGTGKKSFVKAVKTLQGMLAQEPEKLENVRKAEDWVRMYDAVAPSLSE